jgi:cell division protein FtsN
MTSPSGKSQRGGFFVGMIVGLLVGLALALGVALYITKVPLPFIDKVPQRTPEQNAAEAEHNKNWDPNKPLYGKNPAKPHAVRTEAPQEPASAASSEEAAVPHDVHADQAASAPKSAASAARDPAAILAGQAVSSAPVADALTYQVQAGAYGSQIEAEQQRAKLAMMGFESRIVEREVNGRTMYRVRIGPYAQREQADEVRTRLQASGIDSVLVRLK